MAFLFLLKFELISWQFRALQLCPIRTPHLYVTLIEKMQCVYICDVVGALCRKMD